MPASPIWAVIPVKPLALGKSRVGLPSGQRVRINEALLRHVVATTAKALSAAHVVVVSRDERALTIARQMGARSVREDELADLNDALASGARFAADRGAEAVLSLFSDLPHVAVADIHAMLEAFTRDNVVMAPDERGIGTNAMVMKPNHLPYRHGANSLWRHVEAARETGTSFSLVRRDGLMHDLDTAEQFAALRMSLDQTVLLRSA